MAYQYIKITPYKNKQALRTYCSKLNGVFIVSPAKSVLKTLQKMTGKKTIPGNVNLAYRMKIYYTDDKEIELDKWFSLTKKWLENHIGEDKIYAVVANPDHTPCYITAIVFCFNNDKFDYPFKTKKSLTNLHESYSKNVSSYLTDTKFRKTEHVSYQILQDYKKASKEKLPPTLQIEFEDDDKNKLMDIKRQLRTQNLQLFYKELWIKDHRQLPGLNKLYQKLINEQFYKIGKLYDEEKRINELEEKWNDISKTLDKLKITAPDSYNKYMSILNKLAKEA